MNDETFRRMASQTTQELDAALAEAQAEIARLREALRELDGVSRHAVGLSLKYDDFKLYAMEPMHQALDVSLAALEAKHG